MLSSSVSFQCLWTCVAYSISEIPRAENMASKYQTLNIPHQGVVGVTLGKATGPDRFNNLFTPNKSDNDFPPTRLHPQLVYSASTYLYPWK